MALIINVSVLRATHSTRECSNKFKGFNAKAVFIGPTIRAMKHGVRSGIDTINEMSDGEGTGTQPPAPQISQQILTPATGQEPDNMASAIPTLPSGLKPPQPLKADGNLTTNWKRFKRTWHTVTTRLWQGWSDSMKNSKWQCSCR